MTDFIFSNASGNVNVTFKTDLIGVSGANNCTIMDIIGLDLSSTTLNNKQKMLTVFKKWTGGPDRVIKYGVGDFVAFATAHELNLTQLYAGVATVLVSLGSTSS